MSKENFPALTGIRAIAAFMVYVHHYNPFDEVIFGKKIHDFFGEFHVGVTIFFVLSGFLICNRYWDDINFNFKEYFIKRFARIYPMYFILTTLTFIFFEIYSSGTSFENLKTYLFNISFLRGFSDNLKFTGIAQGWSLTVEEMFYFLAPLFFIFIKKSKIFIFLIPSFLVLIGVFLVSVFSESNTYSLMETYSFMFDFTFFGRVTEFFVGIALAIFIKKHHNYFKGRYYTLIGIIMIVFWVYLLSILKGGNGAGTDCFFGKIINTLLLPLFGIAPLFYGLIKEKTFLSKMLGSKTCILLGQSSYVFYLIHIGIFMILLNKISSNQLFLFLGLNLISIVLYLFIETPLNRFFRKNVS